MVDHAKHSPHHHLRSALERHQRTVERMREHAETLDQERAAVRAELDQAITDANQGDVNTVPSDGQTAGS